jgi:RNA polymerase sigma factor (sigma-70 family)
MQIPAHTLEGCRQQKNAAQEALYRLCYPALMRLTMRYARNQADAADILNRGFFKVFTKIDQFNGTEENFGGWIKRIVVNEALDFVRTHPAFNAHQALEEAMHLSESHAEEQKETAQNIILLLQQLPLTTATVFNLFALEGYSHREISESLGISEVNSKWHLHSARQKLQQLLRQTAAL